MDSGLRCNGVLESSAGGFAVGLNGRETTQIRRRRNEYYIYTLVVISCVPTVLMVYFSAIQLKYYLAR